MIICHNTILLLLIFSNRFMTVCSEWNIRKIFADNLGNQNLRDEIKGHKNVQQHSIFNAKTSKDDDSNEEQLKVNDDSDDYDYDYKLNEPNFDKSNYFIKTGKLVSGRISPFDKSKNFEIYLKPAKLHLNKKNNVAKKTISDVKRQKLRNNVLKLYSIDKPATSLGLRCNSTSLKEVTTSYQTTTNHLQISQNLNPADALNPVKCNGSIEGIIVLSFNFTDNKNNNTSFRKPIPLTRKISKNKLTPKKVLKSHDDDKSAGIKIRNRVHSNRNRSRFKNDFHDLNKYSYDEVEFDELVPYPRRNYVNHKRNFPSKNKLQTYYYDD